MDTQENSQTALEIENEKLKKLNEFKTDVISISAHELRTSLSALKWILKMFIDEDIGKLTEEQKNLMSKAFDSNERMIGLVSELLTINHSDDINLTYDFTKESLPRLLETTLFDFVGESYKRGVEIIFLKPEGTISDVFIDLSKIRIIIQGLIENAIKYSRPGDKIFISIKEHPANVELSIRDTGIGITEEDQARIFEKFFRAKNAKEHQSVGSGFGLYLIKKIVEHHKGTIWFESKENEGSTFFVSFPKK